jgi:hypothetical protein
MSRSGYTSEEDCDIPVAMWRGIIASATRGRRGQAFFRSLVAALDAMPVKELIEGELEEEGAVCALGALGKAKGCDLSEIDTYDYDALSATFDIASQLAQETMYVNDEGGPWRPHHQKEPPTERWARVRAWADEQIRRTASQSSKRG